ncbi:MAG: hypothetical protein KDB53_20705, partial [Planctomycetes bacterium]|nr:hypothetical protein [Planctomycetota bacterium]
KRRLLGGFLAGWSLALDYAGVVPLLLIYGYLIASRWRTAGGKTAILESIPFILGAVPPVAFLCWTQWWMYGDPFLPGQFHMPDQNIYVGRGMRGFGMPDLEVFYENLMSPDYGLIAFAPILILGFLPAWYRRSPLVLPRREALFVATFTLAFLVFCASNSYSLLQFNTGFRYLLPLVPFLFLAAADHLKRMPRWLLFLVGLPCLLHGWVLAMVRFTRPRLEDTIQAVPESWRRILEDGLALPWLTVLRQTNADPGHFMHWRIWPFACFFFTGLVAWGIWRCGRRPLQELPTSMHRAVLPTDPVDQ